MNKSPWLKLVLGSVVLVGVFLIFRALHIDFSRITPEKFKETINGFGIWGPVLYIIFYIARPLILFPAALLSASAGVIWGVKGFIYLQIAANLSAVGEFFIARYLAREAVEKFLKGKIGNIDEAIEKRGFVTVLLIRLIPNLAWDIQNFALGLTKVKFRDYFWATFFGIMPGSFALVYFGSSFISVLVNPKNIWKIGVAILLFGFVYWFQKFLKNRKKGGCMKTYLLVMTFLFMNFQIPEVSMAQEKGSPGLKVDMMATDFSALTYTGKKSPFPVTIKRGQLFLFFIGENGARFVIYSSSHFRVDLKILRNWE